MHITAPPTIVGMPVVVYSTVLLFFIQLRTAVAAAVDRDDGNGDAPPFLFYWRSPTLSSLCADKEREENREG